MNYGLVDIIKLIGSISLFLYAMKTMSEGVQKVAGGALRSFLNQVTTNRYLGVLSGFLITGIIQSSSATSVMVVSFVNAGLLTLKQSIGVIMGANIGTTVTSWLINGLGFSNISLTVIALSTIALAVPLYYSGSAKGKSWGEFLVGFGLLFLGLDFMKNSVPVVENFDVEFLSFLQQYTESWFSLPLFIVLGTIIAVILQSSSTAMGVTIVLVSQGWLPMHAAVGLILGENLGTTITANLASVVANVNAKRAARIHTIFNLFGMFWVLPLLPWMIDLVDYLNMDLFGAKRSINSANLYHRGLAMTSAVTIFHTIFNIINTLLLINFVPQLITLSKKVVPSVKDKKAGQVTANNFIEMPEMAVMQAGKQLEKLSESTLKILKRYRDLYFEKEVIGADLLLKLQKHKSKAQDLQMETVSFLVDFSQSNTSEGTSLAAVKMLQISVELKHLSESLNELWEIEKLCYDEGVEFNEEMKLDLRTLIIEVEGSHKLMRQNLKHWEKPLYPEVILNQEERISSIKKTIKKKYLNQLEHFSGDTKQAMYFRDVFSSLEKSGNYIFNANSFLSGLR